MTPNRTSPLRLTFNKPVVVHNFVNHGEEQTKGLKVRIEDGHVHFLPVSEVKDADDVHLIGDSPTSFSRKRGGAEVQIAGTMAAKVAEAFKNPAGPFFTLSREKDGWLVARPHVSSQAPSRFEAHLRVWNDEHGRIVRNAPKAKKQGGTPKVTKPRAPKVNENIVDFAEMAARIHHAREVVDSVSGIRRPGRPARELTDARATLVAFERLVADFGGGMVATDGELARVTAELRNAQSELRQAREMLAQAQANLKSYSERQQDAIHETQDLLDRVFSNTRKDVEPIPARVQAKAPVAPVARAPKASPAPKPRAAKAAAKAAPVTVAAKAVVPKVVAPTPEPVLVRRTRADRKEGRRGGRLSARERRALNA